MLHEVPNALLLVAYTLALGGVGGLLARYSFTHGLVPQVQSVQPAAQPVAAQPAAQAVVELPARAHAA